MAPAVRPVVRIAILAVFSLALTRCSSMAAPRAKAPALLPSASASVDAEPPARNAPDDPEADFDPEFRLEALRRDIDRAVGRTPEVFQAQRPSAAEPRLPRVPVKKLVPEWRPISPDAELDDESDDEAALPRPFATDERASDRETRVPGTVAESSAEEVDELYEAAVHLRSGRLDRGLSALRRFLDRDPRHAYADRAERMIAQAHLDAGEWTLAIAAANRLAISFPGTLAAVDAVTIRSKALRALGYPVASSADRPR